MRAAILRMLAPVGDAFCDHSGGVSVMRIMSFLVCVVVLGLWVGFCFIEGRYIPLGWAEAGLIGAACGAKAAQSRFELGAGGLGTFGGLRDEGGEHVGESYKLD